MCLLCSHCYVPELFLGLPVLLLLGNPSFVGVTSRARGSALDLCSRPRCPQFHSAVWSQGRLQLMTPNHPQAAPIIQPRTSSAVQRQRIPSLYNTFSLFICYFLHHLAFKEFKISSMNSSKLHFEKAVHWFCRGVTTTDSAQGWQGKAELLTQQPGSTVTSNISLAMSTGEKDAVAQSRSLPVCAMGLQPIPHHPSKFSPSSTRALPAPFFSWSVTSAGAPITNSWT